MKQVLTTFISFWLIDGLWITFVASPLYKRHFSKDILLSHPKLSYTLLFYLIFPFALWFVVIQTQSTDLKVTLLKAAVFGIAAYSTYALTNLAIFSGWKFYVALADILWGGFVCALVTFIVTSIN